MVVLLSREVYSLQFTVDSFGDLLGWDFRIPAGYGGDSEIATEKVLGLPYCKLFTVNC